MKKIIENGYGMSWKYHGISFPDICENPGRCTAIFYPVRLYANVACSLFSLSDHVDLLYQAFRPKADDQAILLCHVCFWLSCKENIFNRFISHSIRL